MCNGSFQLSFLAVWSIFLTLRLLRKKPSHFPIVIISARISLVALRELARRRAVEHALPLASAFLNMALECARVERLQELEGAEQFSRDAHDGAPVIEFAAILLR
jgi:hypothetical protein